MINSDLSRTSLSGLNPKKDPGDISLMDRKSIITPPVAIIYPAYWLSEPGTNTASTGKKIA